MANTLWERRGSQERKIPATVFVRAAERPIPPSPEERGCATSGSAMVVESASRNMLPPATHPQSRDLPAAVGLRA